MNGLTPIRTARTISVLIAIIGMLILLVSRVLMAVVSMANEAIQLALARYSNFTGRIAARNFAEDRQLLKMLKDVNALMPTAETALTIMFIVSIVVLIVALFGLAFPKQFLHVLVALKILKWDAIEPMKGLLEDEVEVPSTPMSNRSKIILATSVIVVVSVILSIVAMFAYADERKEIDLASAVNNMQEWAGGYIDAQKAYFAKNNAIGGPKALQLPDTASTDFFKYKITASRFVAETKVPMGNCPAGSKWSVNSSTKGFFTVELQLYRAVPKDTACANLTPEFKHIGKHKKASTSADSAKK